MSLISIGISFIKLKLCLLIFKGTLFIKLKLISFFGRKWWIKLLSHWKVFFHGYCWMFNLCRSFWKGVLLYNNVDKCCPLPYSPPSGSSANLQRGRQPEHLRFSLITIYFAESLIIYLLFTYQEQHVQRLTKSLRKFVYVVRKAFCRNWFWFFYGRFTVSIPNNMMIVH